MNQNEQLAWSRISDTEAVAMYRDEDAAMSCGPLDWPREHIESIVLDASADVNRAFYERGDTANDDLEEAEESAIHGGDVIGNLDAGFDNKGWTHTTLSLDDGRNHWVSLYIALSPEYGDAESHADVIRRWWDGDVFVFELQKLVTWTSGDGRTRREWETADAIGDCYVDDRTPWEEQAREALGITKR